jgi:hypothetical protein
MITESSLDGSTKREKYLKLYVKLFFLINPALWRAAIEPGGGLSKSFDFMLFLGNQKR